MCPSADARLSFKMLYFLGLTNLGEVHSGSKAKIKYTLRPATLIHEKTVVWRRLPCFLLPRLL